VSVRCADTEKKPLSYVWCCWAIIMESISAQTRTHVPGLHRPRAERICIAGARQVRGVGAHPKQSARVGEPTYVFSHQDLVVHRDRQSGKGIFIGAIGRNKIRMILGPSSYSTQAKPIHRYPLVVRRLNNSTHGSRALKIKSTLN
jgi:hypothetical protein